MYRIDYLELKDAPKDVAHDAGGQSVFQSLEKVLQPTTSNRSEKRPGNTTSKNPVRKKVFHLFNV